MRGWPLRVHSSISISDNYRILRFHFPPPTLLRPKSISVTSFDIPLSAYSISSPAIFSSARAASIQKLAPRALLPWRKVVRGMPSSREEMWSLRGM